MRSDPHKFHQLFAGRWCFGTCYRIKNDGPGNRPHIKVWIKRRVV